MRNLSQIKNYLILGFLTAMLFSGCANKLNPTPVACPAIPEMPLLLEQEPSQPYSQSALENIQKWQNMLTEIIKK